MTHHHNILWQHHIYTTSTYTWQQLTFLYVTLQTMHTPCTAQFRIESDHLVKGLPTHALTAMEKLRAGMLTSVGLL